MRIRDDVFLNAQAPAPTVPAKLTATELELLRGIGDRGQRAANILLDAADLGAGAPAPEGWKAGQPVQFTTPDTQVRTGTLVRRAAGEDWLVQLDEHTFNLVPESELRTDAKAASKNQRAALTAAIRRPTSLRAVHAKRAVGNDFLLVLAYDHGNKPSEDELAAYIATNYEGARVLDADDTQPGRLAVVVSHEAATPPVPAESRSPGLITEELEGDGMQTPLGSVQAHFMRCASAQSVYTFHVTSTEQFADDSGKPAARINFSLIGEDDQPLYLQGKSVTATLSETAVPASGYLDSKTLKAMLYGIDGEFALSAASYDSGTGPNNIHEDETGVAETGSYVVTAEDLQKEAGPWSKVLGPAALGLREAAPSGQMVDYRKEKERYDLEHGQTESEEARAIRRIKERRQQAPQRELDTTDFAPVTGAGGPSAIGGASPATDEEDGEVREVLVPPTNPDFKQQIMAVDQTAKDYWTNYEGEYGKQLTNDMPRKQHTAQQQGVPIAQVVTGLSSNPAVAADVSKILGDFLTKSTTGGNLVDQLKRLDTSNTLLPKLIYGAFSDPKYGKQLGQLYGKNQGQMPIGQVPGQESPDAATPTAPATTTQQPSNDSRGQAEKAVNKAIFDKNLVLSPQQKEDLIQQYMTPAQGQPAQTQQTQQTQPTQQQPESYEPPDEDEMSYDEQKQRQQETNPLGLTGPEKKFMGASKKAMVTMRLDELTRKGDYVHASIVWDSDVCEGMSAANIRHAVISFIKGEASKKDYRDLGTISRPMFVMFDPDAGMAEVQFRSSEARSVTPEVNEGSTEHHEPNK